MLSPRPSAPQLVGQAPAWLSALEHVSLVAPLERPILVIGERGTGKELIGERLHFLSRRWDGPFIKVNCAALSEDLLDSELFGHERGAFTGATDRRAGRFELADGGTVFLDEIATASMRVQEKLLRVVEYGEYQRLGGQQVLHTDVRVAAATNIDLPSAVARGAFRADLLDRLAFDVITLPPLRAREGDASLLADFFARRMAVEMGEDFPGFAPSAMAAIEAHDWPGNVRELRNAAERHALGVADLDTPAADTGTAHLSDLMAAHERKLLVDALVRHRGALKPVYESLGLSRKALYDKLTRHGIDKSQFQDGSSDE